MPALTCTICGSGSGVVHRAREMMFGLRDEFDYSECRSCGVLRLLDCPDEMKRYYPSNYYAHGNPDVPVNNSRTRVKKWLAEKRNESRLLGRWGVGAIAGKLRPDRRPDEFQWLFRHSSIKSLNSPILDVGCGNGTLLRSLAAIGFRNLWGIDPYLDHDEHVDGRVRLIKGPLSTVKGRKFHLIMLHHSLEHMPDQAESLVQIRSVLSRRGTCIVRIPLAQSDPWERYGRDWVELDAPRHFWLHSRTSFEQIAAKCGLQVIDFKCDSTPFAYWGSELYRRNVSLFDPNSKEKSSPENFFSQDEMEQFARQADRANRNETGGRAAFWLCKRSTRQS